MDDKTRVDSFLRCAFKVGGRWKGDVRDVINCISGMESITRRATTG